MILEEVKLGEDIESKKKAILENLGEQVILCDNHNCWVHGLLSRENYDDQCYQIHMEDPRGMRELWYNDLQKLLLLKPHKDYPRPKLRID